MAGETVGTLEYLAQLAMWSFTAFGALLMAMQLVFYLVGFRLGGYRRAHSDTEPEGVGIIVGGIMALLGFVLALTLSFANSRYDDRRMGTLAESNAIGTAWLRAEAIGHPRGRAVGELLEQYIQVRLDYVRADPAMGTVTNLNARTNALQSEIWGHVSAIVREQPSPVTASLMASVNDAFDATTALRFAFASRVPNQIFWLLLGMTMVGIGALGYQVGLRGKPVRGMVLLLTLTWTAVIIEIVDLASPRIGSMRTGAVAYEWAQQGMKGGVTIPPAPPPR
jgi:hypothetical protein